MRAKSPDFEIHSTREEGRVFQSSPASLTVSFPFQHNRANAGYSIVAFWLFWWFHGNRLRMLTFYPTKSIQKPNHIERPNEDSSWMSCILEWRKKSPQTNILSVLVGCEEIESAPRPFTRIEHTVRTFNKHDPPSHPIQMSQEIWWQCEEWRPLRIALY